MKIYKCKQRDLVPLTVNALLLYHDIYISNIFKFRILEDFPDLKGLIPTDWLDGTSYELIHTEPSNDALRIAYESLYELMDTSRTICNLYGLDLEITCQEGRDKDSLGELYYGVVLDQFPEDGCSEEYTSDDYHEFLHLFALSGVLLVRSLCSLFSDGEFDLDEVWEIDQYWCEFLGKDYSEQEDFVTLDLLQQLGQRLSEHHMEIV